jgi:hypothetical protein
MDLRKRVSDLECRAAIRLDPFAPPADAEACQDELSRPAEQRSLWGIRHALTLAKMRASVPLTDLIEQQKQLADVGRLQRLYDERVSLAKRS